MKIVANLIGFFVLFFAIQYAIWTFVLGNYIVAITNICLSTGMVHDENCSLLLNDIPHEIALQSAPLIVFFALCVLISINYIVFKFRSKRS